MDKAENIAFVEKCISFYKKNNGMRIILVDDIRHFLVDDLKITGIKPKELKKNLIEIAYQNLNPENINLYAKHLPNFGFTLYDMMELLDITKYRAQKLVKNGYVRKIGEYETRGYDKRRYYIYSIPDVISVHDNNIIQKTERTYNVEATDENIASALYLINKSAKVSRDTKVNAYHSRKFSVCNASKTRASNLYDLKDKAMKVLISDGRMTYQGIHIQKIESEDVYLDFYRMGDFSFHIPHIGMINQNDILGVIEGEISAEKTKVANINFNEAKYLLTKLVS